MTPIGLDLSLTSTGFSCGQLRTAIARKDRGMARIAGIRDAVVDLVLRIDDPLVLVEGYSFSSRNSHSHAAGELGGVIRLWMWESGIPYIDVPPTSRAKFATGKGNAAKNEVVSAVSARTGIVWTGSGADDMCDAWILEQIGLTKLGRSEYDWPKANLEALVKLDWTSVGL